MSENAGRLQAAGLEVVELPLLPNPSSERQTRRQGST